ncbi:archaeosortase A [Halorutilales archaeon Cl-col2-1]
MVGPLIWISIGLFLAGMVLEDWSDELAAGGWIAFGAYWMMRFPVYYQETHSFIKSILVLVALPVSVYVAYEIYTNQRDSLVKLSHAVAAMGLIYLPFAFVDPLRAALIEHTARQSYRLLQILGVETTLTTRDGVLNTFVTTNPATGETYVTYIILACTGIGSMSIFGGVVAAVDAPLDKKIKALGVSIPSIYVLNLIRNAFITTSYGYQWFPLAEETISGMMGEPYGYASFFWADKVISQSLSVVVLVILTMAVVRLMPEVHDLLTDVLDVLAGKSA